MIREQVLVTGSPRSGTTMLILMMKYFEGCNVYSDKERHPLHPNKLMWHQYQYVVIKQPYGYYEHFPPYYDFQMLFKRKYKIICMIRNYRDVLVSRHANNPEVYWVWPTIWIRCARQIIMNIDNPRLLMVKYEDLVSDSKKQMDRISNFLGCNYKENYIKFYETDDAKNPKNNSLNGPRSISKDSINNWSKPEHKDRVEYLTQFVELEELNNQLGYEYTQNKVIWR